MNLSQLMAGLAKNLGLDGLAQSDDGFYRLTLDDDLTLRIAENEETAELVVLCHLLNLPEADDGADVMRMLLGANFRWAFSARGHFAMNPETDAVEFALREKLDDLDVNRFELVLQAIGSVLATVKAEVRRGGLGNGFTQGLFAAPSGSLPA